MYKKADWTDLLEMVPAVNSKIYWVRVWVKMQPRLMRGQVLKVEIPVDGERVSQEVTVWMAVGQPPQSQVM